MADFRPMARVVRWAAGSMAYQLGLLPADKLDWKPTPECKSALEVAGEAAGVMRMMLPVLAGGELQPPAQRPEPPASLEAASRALAESAEAYAAALEAAGPELDRRLETPFGPLWGTYGVTFGMIDLLHHHGQITYLQSLLGDAENHIDPPAMAQWFGPPQ